MAGSVESRLQALERARALPLPLYVLTFTDGSSRFMDALGAMLYLARLDAGAETLQLPIFTDNASRIKKTANGTGSAYYWWLRSATASNTSNFEGVYGNGTSYYNGASNTGGVCFGFCI